MGYETIGEGDPILVAGLVLAVVAYLWLYRWTQRNQAGPKKWSILGNYLEMMMNYDGPCVHAERTCVFEPLRNGAEGPLLYEAVNILFGDGIFIVDGEKWKLVRKLASLEFSSRKLRHFSTAVYRNDGIRLANILAEAADSSKTVELQDLLLRMTMESFCKIGLGKDLHTLRADLPRSKFTEALKRISVLIQTRQIGPVWKLKRALNIGTEREMEQLRKNLDEFLYKIINSRKA